MNVLNRSVVKVLLVFVAILFFNTPFAHSSASVSLRWDANDPAPEGYRVFAREAGGSYDYLHPIWDDNVTTCTLTGLSEGVTYYFVVRAYEGTLESVDSEEVVYTPPLPNTEPDIDYDAGIGSNTDNESGTGAEVDSDQDNVPDSQDLFPFDPNEWFDTDGDGIGNNQDTDDDNDGMTDSWEVANGLNPLVDDALLDSDGDGVSNIDEFQSNTSAENATANQPPSSPVVESAHGADRVTLTPVLVCGEYFDADDDRHYQTRWQVSTDADFSTLVLNSISSTQLYAYAVGEMLLDVDTVYYWRAQFIDTHNDASEWSRTATFTTVTAENIGDADFDGVLDTQAAEETFDINANGIADTLETNIMTFNTVEGQTTVGVETSSNTVTLVSVKSISAEAIADKSIKLGFGLVGFKLYLQDGVKTASVKIHFTQIVPEDAKLYKYNAENGWREYENAVFADNRKSVTLVLEDGGPGDEDGVVNGIIVDPSGIAYEAATISSDSAAVSTADTLGASGGGGSCFISAGSDGLAAGTVTLAMLLTTVLLIAGTICAKVFVRVER